MKPLLLFCLVTCFTNYVCAQTVYTIKGVEKVVIYRHLDYWCPGDPCGYGDTLHFFGKNIYTAKGDTNYKNVFGKDKAQWLARQLSNRKNFEGDGEGVGTPLIDYSIFFYDKNDSLIACELFGFDRTLGSGDRGVVLVRGALDGKGFKKVHKFFAENNLRHPQTIDVCHSPCRKNKNK